MDISSFAFATIDTKSNILFQNQIFENLFNSKNNLYDHILLNPYKKTLVNADKLILEQGISTQILLINIFEDNIILKKLPLVAYNQIVGIQIIAEVLKFNSFNKISRNNSRLSAEILEEHKIISGYSQFQQEIIFCLLNNKHSDKAIANFIQSKVETVIEPRAVKDSISAIFKKLRVTDRNELVFCLQHLGFNKYIPKTLYTSGVYYSL